MPREKKCRRVCAEFLHKVFTPEDCKKGFVTVTVDELEAMRLCDLERLDQEEGAKRMDISRGTYQRILYSGRQKTVEALSEGKGIIISGGNYELATNYCEYPKKCVRCKWQDDKNSTG